MNNVIKLLVGLFLISIMNSCSKDPEDVEPPIVKKYNIINIETIYGNIDIWLYDETPKHKANFLKLTDEGYFDSVIFHRVIKNFVIQTGDPTATGNGGPGYTIDAEFDTSLKHDYGAVGAARLPDAVNPEKASSGSQFYIVQKKSGAHYLNMEYTVFGFVLIGMDVVDQIASVETNNKDRPIVDIYMKDVNIVKYTAEELLTNYGFVVTE